MSEWQLIQEIIEQGLILSLVTCAVFLSSRVMRFDDLTVEGSFTAGGAFAVLSLSAGLSPWVTLLLPPIVGFAAGSVTGFLHTRLRMTPMLSGVSTSTALFSLNLVLVGSNHSLAHSDTVFSTLPYPGVTRLLLLAGVIIAAFTAVKWLLRTEVGLVMRACGENSAFVRALGKSPERYKTATLGLANSLTALAGALFVQWAGFFSLTASVGMFVTGMSSLILGTLFSPRFGLLLILGAMIYQGAFALAIQTGLDPRWNYLLKALLVVLFLQLQRRRVACSA